MHSTSQQGNAGGGSPLRSWFRGGIRAAEWIRLVLKTVTGRAQSQLECTARYSGPTILPPLPLRTTSLCTNEFDACAALYALVLHFDGPARTRQLQRIAWHAEQSMIARMLEIEPHLIDLSPGERISLASIAVRRLDNLQPHIRQRFTANIRALITADDSVSLFECIVLLLIESSAPLEQRELTQRATDLTEVGEQVIALLVAFVSTGSLTRDRALRTLNTALRQMGLPLRTSFPPPITFERLSWAIRGLRRSSPPLVKIIIQGCQIALGEVSGYTGEGELTEALLLGLRLCLNADELIQAEPFCRAHSS